MLTRLVEEIELLERHVQILRLVVEKEPIGIIKLSEASNVPQHKIRYSLRVLEHKGMISPSPRGAVATEEAGKFLKNLSKQIEIAIKKIQTIR